ncbi:RNA polymerase sigma factor [Paludisphaera mucosa]|uniref:Sigma-70 family RNA polymerase sigma factor n=1 Tax=Paludisphaera mucosa TaxID=3030827 RepID=A0ABT6F3V5_9BACT|nr:sigma-70 family RNA polymerase sigma factor [Paludisphaera mucosa]MDG3002262.1 sigma-70 family RNA polymerase sigma factor [Paludisphaera mucosa]
MPDWDEILAREGPAVWRTAYRILGDRADADECFQEAFLDAWEVSRRGPVRSRPALLKRLVAARAVDRLRRRARRGSHGAVADWDALGGPGPSPSRSAEDSELPRRLREALARLPAKQAQAFCLRALEEWSYAEIAEHLGATVDAVGVLLHRARTRLRALLARPREVPGPPLAAEEPS